MKNSVYAWLVVGNVASIVFIQVTPMLVLPVRGYATYSILYLAFAAFLALQSATACDVLARRMRRSEATSSLLRTFQAAVTALAVTGGLASGLFTMVATGDELLAAAASVATAAAMYRSGVTYRLVALNRVGRAGLSEILGALGSAVAAVAALVMDVYSVHTALSCWAIGTLCASLVAGIRPVLSPRAAIAWFSRHRRDITLLMTESVIKTAETVGTPYLVGAVGGALALALHRAASSLTYPVRLVVEMLRARIISGAIRSSSRAVLAIGGFGALAGAAVAVGLSLLYRAGVVGSGTIVDAMAPHAPAVGTWILAMSVSSFVQFAGRGSFTGRRLIARRVATTLVVLAVTGSGVLVLGIGAVIWSAALAEGLATLIWISRGADRRAGAETTPRFADRVSDDGAPESGVEVTAHAR